MLQSGFSCIVTSFFNLAWLPISRIIQSSSKFLITNPKQCVFLSYPLCIPPPCLEHQKIIGLVLSKLHYTCGYLALVLASVAKPRKILRWFSNTNVPNATQYHHHQSYYKSNEKPQEKKKSALTEWYKSIFWNSHLCPRRKKNLRTIKTILRYLSFAPF